MLSLILLINDYVSKLILYTDIEYLLGYKQIANVLLLNRSMIFMKN